MKIAIVLSGCGVNDGSEIHEAVMTLLAIVKAGAEPLFYAPDISQKQVTNHYTKSQIVEMRNVLAESARIARGSIKPLSELRVSDVDALVFPGGFGAALNLCDFAVKGPECQVEKDVERVVREFHHAKKPIGAICIAPAVIAKVLGSTGVELTIGTDTGTAQVLEKMGAKHVKKTVTEIHIDEKNRVVSTPAYMLAQNIAEVEIGVGKLVQALLTM